MGPRVSSTALAERLESVIGPNGLMNPGKIFAGARP